MITVQQSALDRAHLSALAIDADSLRDDGTDYTGLVIEKPWGREWQVELRDGWSIWRLEMSPCSETSLHAHPSKMTILYIAEGNVTFSTLEKRFELGPGGFLVIERGVFHRTETIGGAVIYEQETPANKLDLVRLTDRYGREGKGYEKPAGN